ncbi:unnamed protein product [Microthlaspi erraticum]|uniref:Uncharacterized protein n=1 Tax=Microthlaspi erraticum TaxID=1685480 RepID=A0A6D2KU43_9BRAS|nr:unnamed protein product [Microthlaspi erraticum]
MVAPSVVAAVSSSLPPPCPAVIEQPMEKALVSESTLSQLGFPSEFPYEFDSSAFTSPDDSTETKDETSDDEDDFLAGLTRRLALSTQRLSSPPSLVTDKSEVKPPESTLSGVVSPNGPFSQVPSPPTSPSPEDESLKVISAAAGEVAKMKKMAAKPNSNSPPNPKPNSFIPFPPHQNAAFFSYYYWLWPSQTPPYNHQSPIMTLPPALIAPPFPVLAAPTAAKQPSTGTGVFIPRKFPNPSDDSQKKSGDECVKIPKKVVHQQKPKTKESSVRCQPHLQARLSKGHSKIGKECVKTKPSQRPVSGGCVKEERSLPQEWIY